MPTPLELVRGLYAAFAAGDIPAFLSALAPDVHWCEAEGFPLADRNPYVGIDAIVHGVFARLGDHFLDFRVEPAEFAGSGDVVTMFGRYRATCRTSGKPLDVQVAHTFWIANDKVVRFQQMCDTAAVASALAPAAPSPKPQRAAKATPKPAPKQTAKKAKRSQPARKAKPVRGKPAAKTSKASKAAKGKPKRPAKRSR